jgi:hypothetical protein
LWKQVREEQGGEDFLERRREEKREDLLRF